MSEGNVVLTMTRRINASAERLYDAWTKPELMKKWFHPGKGWSTTLAENELRVGGDWRIQMTKPDGVTHFPGVGKYKLLERPSKLVFTWHPFAEAGYETVVTILLKKVSESVTELTLIHEGL
ncbi:MAG TPA: SRPBCC domain-containing protein, partial [bacterium]|nr:SRPBCC domain-containing protein [bacterium]